jgi:hypothetical protein
MKNSVLIIAILLCLISFSFQTKEQSSEIPKKGILEINAKNDISFWKGIKHASFRVYLTNPSKTNSCEAYYVKNGVENWISPSLLANGKLDFNVPRNAHVFFKNFSNENLKITYTIE